MHVQMTSNKLDGTNYSTWSQFVKLYVTRKEKLGYLTGEKKQPTISNPFFSTWVKENAMLMSWLLNSMTLILVHLSSDFLQLTLFGMLWLKHILMVMMLLKFMNLSARQMRLDNKEQLTNHFSSR